MSKTVVTLLLGGLLIVVVGFFRLPGEWVNLGLNVSEFQMQKINSGSEYDIVITGDSRAQIGMSPSAMKTILSEYKIINFAFDHNAYNKEYLEAISERLDPSSNKRTIILCISPQSLTDEAASRNGFLSLKNRTKAEGFESLYLSNFLEHFKTFDPYDMVGYLRGIPQMKYYQEYHSDGFIASWKEPPDTMYQVNRYSDRFDNNRVSDKLTMQLMDFVSRWVAEGIDVIGVRLPTSEPMLRLETQKSGFNEDKFIKMFAEAGGKWLILPTGVYDSYDGSHLHRDAAIRLSKDLAVKLVDNGIKKSFDETEK